ncbi:hypothetical protein COW46_00700 [Candidatus Gracilibacteria bacterium CG17_big_fil_post_rev_8_21_14_2_50_48_13]|nr:MAG: hypothetical protein COW46_00700 [Candidatus Gracilibacteria bacterium CG17_big_fil_post_rev_8_21_14_2_50_48_13]
MGSTNRPSWIVVHHTAVSYDKNPSQLSATNTFHKNKGFPQSSLGFFVGYHAMVEKDGRVIITRKDSDIGAHTSQDNMNFNSVAICFTGNFDKEEPTLEQCKAGLSWIKGKMSSLHIPASKIKPHRNWAPKTCWGSKVPDDIISYLEQRCMVVDETPSSWALPSFAKAAKLGMSDARPKEEVGTSRLRFILNKLYQKQVIEEKDAPVTYEEYIHALDKAGVLPA